MMRKIQWVLFAMSMATFSLTTAACSDDSNEKVIEEPDAGDIEEKGKVFCEAYSKIILDLLDSLDEQIDEDIAFSVKALFDQQRCESLFENLSFCDETIVDTAAAALDLNKNCIIPKEECKEICYEKYDECVGMYEKCNTDFSSCQEADGEDCSSKYGECRNNVDKCYNELYDEFYNCKDECEDQYEICFKQYDLPKKILRAAFCIEDNYTPAISLETFVVSRSQECGFETINEFSNFLQSNVLNELKDEGFTSEEIDEFSDSAVSLISCIFENSEIQCSEVFEIIDMMMEGDEPDQAAQEKMISLMNEAAEAIYYCPNELFGVGPAVVDYALSSFNF